MWGFTPTGRPAPAGFFELGLGGSSERLTSCAPPGGAFPVLRGSADCREAARKVGAAIHACMEWYHVLCKQVQHGEEEGGARPIHPCLL